MVELISALLALAVAVVIYFQRNKPRVPKGYRVSYGQYDGGVICHIYNPQTMESLVIGLGATELAAYQNALSKL